MYQGGAFSSLWIRVGCEPDLVSASALDVLVGAALAKQCTLPKPGAVYVALSETSVDAAHVRCLLAKGFRFYHHRTSPEGDDELVYYAWPDRPDYPDKVPPYATSTEGVGAILLSPDETRVLLVWEYGCWKMPTGAVDAGEGALSALRREVGEEVGCEVDARYAPVYLGGWQSSRAFDLRVNNNFATYSARATAEKLTIDRNEIGDARWFDIAELRRRAEAAEAAAQPLAGRVELEVGGLAPGLEPGGALVSTTMLSCLEILQSGRGMRCTERPAYLGTPGQDMVSLG